ncbi:MAG: multi-sensor hybrid histidine kinase [uncultured bacterium]|nr:MAG: multi-sensor hybrid histidine kinase [uncultured bacterium]
MKRALWILPSLVIAVFGLSIMFGWWPKIPVFLLTHTAKIIIFYTGLCFTLSGAALFCATFVSRLSARVEIILGVLLCFIALFIFSQNLFDITPDAHPLFLKLWVHYFALHPAHLTPHTSIGFILAGLIFILLPFAYKKWIAFCIEFSIFLLFLVGTLGLTGYLVKVEFLLDWQHYAGMALYTAIGFAVLGIFLWIIWRNNPYSFELYHGKEEQKIMLFSGIILLFISLVVGFISFVTLANQQLDMVKDTFKKTLYTKQILFQNEIMRTVNEFGAFKSNLLLQRLSFNKNDAVFLAQMKNMIAEGFSAVSVKNQQGEIINSTGNFVEAPKLSVKLKLPEEVILFWQNGWYLRITNDFKTVNQQTFTLMTERPLINLNNALKEAALFGKTANMSICVPKSSEHAVCFPTTDYPYYFLFSLNGMQEVPIMPETNADKMNDVSQYRILSVYSPVDSLGFGMLMKIDMTELYKPIMQKLHVVFPVMLIVVLIGLLLLRLEVMPLIRRIFFVEKELMQSNQLLKEGEQLKNEFVSVVSHELRTPLTSIRGSLGLILGGAVGEFSAKAKKLLGIANNNCERLLHLINDILDIEKIEAGKMDFQFAPYRIADLVKESMMANQMYAERFSVKIKLAESVNDVMVNVDRDRFIQVMTNLISNAVKFSRKGGKVVIKIGLVKVQKVRVAIEDQGHGIAKEFQSRIFQKFSQADSTTTRKKGGTGLGLSISKAIIDQFSGSIGFKSDPEMGTIFYFELPIVNMKG